MTEIPFPKSLLAVDIGNSRIKLGRFDQPGECLEVAQQQLFAIAPPALPQPSEILQIPLSDSQGSFDEKVLLTWCGENVPENSRWQVVSVNARAAEKIHRVLLDSQVLSRDQRFPRLTVEDLDLSINVPAPERVGTDRLVTALAANRLRRPDKPAIVVDHGSAITVDAIDSEGAFVGGAILPGWAMSAHALSERTDALPCVAVEQFEQADAAPTPLGDDTQSAIQAGLYWGTVGAVQELIRQIASRQPGTCQVFLTGGGAAGLSKVLAGRSDQSQQGLLEFRHLPNLVLSGIALATSA